MSNPVAHADARSVAVIGLACRLPGASGPEELWRLMRDSVDATSEPPAERRRLEASLLGEDRPKIASRRAGHLGDVTLFDAEFFEMSHSTAAEIDPQQRLLLMTAWEALEDAGLPPGTLAGTRAGVFVGNARADYLELQLRRGERGSTPSMLQNFRSVLPARLSHYFDLRGPSVLVDTACSSSLVAVHQAIQSLRAGEVPVALAAGVSLKLRDDEGALMTRTGAMAGDGRSKFGDASADGYAPSDGVGVVVLKPLADALANGDRIRAVIRGSAVGNDGRTSDSLMTPSAAGQREVLRWALRDADVLPADVDFVEAHGVGSPILDALEINAIGTVLGEGRKPDRPCYVGSVKTNIGHAEAAGGMAGLIKTVLCLEHRQVPASLHHNTPTDAVEWDILPLCVPRDMQDLSDRNKPLIAGVGAQGVSALNAHLVVGEAPRQAPRPRRVRPRADDQPYILPLSAHTPEALEALIDAYVAYLEPQGAGRAFSTRDICYSAAIRRQHHAHRTAVIGASHDQLHAALIAQETNLAVNGPTALLDAAERYRMGQTVDWNEAFAAHGRFVPLPRYPWQLLSYEPGTHPREEPGDDVATQVLREHARTAFAEDSSLSEIGIDSLARLEIVLTLAKTYGHEGDVEQLAELRTVSAFRSWVAELEKRSK